jgi:hypothetical protein
MITTKNCYIFQFIYINLSKAYLYTPKNKSRSLNAVQPSNLETNTKQQAFRPHLHYTITLLYNYKNLHDLVNRRGDGADRELQVPVLGRAQGISLAPKVRRRPGPRQVVLRHRRWRHPQEGELVGVSCGWAQVVAGGEIKRRIQHGVLVVHHVHHLNRSEDRVSTSQTRTIPGIRTHRIQR